MNLCIGNYFWEVLRGEWVNAWLPDHNGRGHIEEDTRRSDISVHCSETEVDRSGTGPDREAGRDSKEKGGRGKVIGFDLEAAAGGNYNPTWERRTSSISASRQERASCSSPWKTRSVLTSADTRGCIETWSLAVGSSCLEGLTRCLTITCSQGSPSC